MRRMSIQVVTFFDSKTIMKYSIRNGSSRSKNGQNVSIKVPKLSPVVFFLISLTLLSSCTTYKKGITLSNKDIRERGESISREDIMDLKIGDRIEYV